MKIEYRFTKKDFIDGRIDNHYSSNHFLFIKISSIYILPFAIMYYFLKLFNITNVFLSLTSYIFIILVAGVLFKNKKARILKKVKDNNHEYFEVTWKPNEDGLHMIQNKFNVSLDWNSITNIVEKPNYIHIYNNRDIPVFIPIKAFKTDEELNSFKDILKENVNSKLYKVRK